MLKTKTSCCVYELGKETAGINIVFGHMAEDVFCVRNTPLGEKKPLPLCATEVENRREP